MNQPSHPSSVSLARSPQTAAGIVMLTVVLHLAGSAWATGLVTALAMGVLYLASFHVGRVVFRSRPRSR